MEQVKLFDYQKDAVEKLSSGKILRGGVGSGKSITSLYYYTQKEYPKQLYIITTAMKRDTGEWLDEMLPFKLINTAVVDSWNNIKKYENIKDQFFIFDEHKAMGKGTWAKTFIKIAKNNHWIILSATPGDNWEDYISVFVAEGFYKNRTDFASKHIIWSPFTTYPKINYFVNVEKLVKLRDSILVEMVSPKSTKRNDIYVFSEYDTSKYRFAIKHRVDPSTCVPFINASEAYLAMRKLVNTSEDRRLNFKKLVAETKKAIVFYNFDFELYLMREALEEMGVPYAEHNGHKHDQIEMLYGNDRWMYLVQYNSGAEAWNCIETDSMIFYSDPYSFKMMEQAKGRIDRANTTFENLYYYHLSSYAPVDNAIRKKLAQRKNFNISKYFKFIEETEDYHG